MAEDGVRVATHKEQCERIVLICFMFAVRARRLLASLRSHCAFPAQSSSLAPQAIRHPPRGDLNQPAARIVGNAFLWPLDDRRQQCLLKSILGRGEVVETADHRAEHLRRNFAQ